MGTSNSATLRAIAAAREAAGVSQSLMEIRDIATEARDASVLVARELMPPVEPAPEPAPTEHEPEEAS